MKNRTNELDFREGYNLRDWKSDARLINAFMYLIPKDEQKMIADTSIKIFNNLSYNHRDRVKAIHALYAPYMTEHHIHSLPKKNVAKFLMKVPSGIVGNEFSKIADKLKKR